MDIFDKKEELIAGLGLVFMGVSYGIYKMAKEAAMYIFNAKEFTAGIVLTEALASSLKEGPSNIPYGAVRGRVVALNPGQTIINSSNMDAVIQTKNTVEHSVYKLASVWADGSRKVQSGLNFIPFGLINPKYSAHGENIPGLSYPNAADILVVDNVGSFGEMHNALVNVKQEMMAPHDFSLIRLIIGFLTDRYSIATYQEEQILPVGSIITIFGELSKMNNGQIRISNPNSTNTPFILTMKTATQLKASYKSSADFSWLIFQGSILFFAVSFAVVCSKWWSKYKMQRVYRLVAAERSNNDNPVAGLHESQICVVCLGNPREVILIPCGHVCVCGDCCLLISRRCPVCRMEFNNIHVAFIP